MKLFNKLYYLVLALAVVFTLNNCSTDQISPQEEEGISTIDYNESMRKGNLPSANGQGSFTTDDFSRKFSFHANTMPDGIVKGNGVLTLTGRIAKIMFDIDCMIVEENTATMTGYITKFDNFPERVGYHCWFMVADNGEGSNANPDALSYFYFWPADEGPDCNVYDALLIEIESGNIQVKNYDEATRHHGDNANPVIHRVSAGGNDWCGAVGLNPGCHGNFSLIAIEKADGTVMGQFQDTFPGGGNGLHVSIDCLYVEDNMAIVSGYITNGSLDGIDYTGSYFITKVVDNGTSKNDPADQMSYGFFSDPDISCELFANADFPLFDIENGQVKVW